MKKWAFILMILVFNIEGLAQEKGRDEAYKYLTELTASDQQIAERMMRYISASTHRSGKSAEGKRKKLERSIQDAYDASVQAPGFNGDKSLRDALIEYHKQNLETYSKDYAKASALSESADQEFSLMESYLQTTESANSKIEDAWEKLHEAKKTFTDAYGIRLVAENSKVHNDLQKSNEVIAYYNTVFLLFFKPFKEDAFLSEAIQSGDIEAIEKHRNQLLEYATASKEELKNVKSFDNDVSLLDACQVALDFFIDEAENYAPSALEFLQLQADFKTAQQAIESKKRSDLTQKEVNDFNALVTKTNDSVNVFNEMSQRYFNLRVAKSDTFMMAGNQFNQRHIPYYEEAETLGT